jgi:DNA-binding transcriptional MerR regulator
MKDAEFMFEPPRRSEMWCNLALTMSQAAALTGVSERQIQHWMDRGYVHPSSEGTRKLNGDGLDEVALIRQARLAGVPLRKAVRMAREYLESDRRREGDRPLSPSLLTEIGDGLRGVSQHLEAVERIVREAGVAVR